VSCAKINTSVLDSVSNGLEGQELYGSRYIIEQKLGEGVFGITYLARNRNRQRVVIKTLKDELLPHRDACLVSGQISG
jgi:hypothetical protein